MSDQHQLVQRYRRIADQLQNLLTRTSDKTARMSTICSLLHHKMPHYFWTGFYLLKQDSLVVGPYQGPLACQVLSGKKGVCWTGVLEKRTLIVPDIHKFPGHVACDERSKSEIVVPWINPNQEVLGVLDVDSQKSNAFSEIDGEWLGKIVDLLNLTF